MKDMLGGQGGQGDMLNELLKQLQSDDSVIRIQMNDQRLTKIAEYDVTKGYTQLTQATPEILQVRFCEYKSIVKKGETTLKQLEDDVYTRWGVTEEKRESAVDKTPEDQKPLIGFSPNSLDVADMDENDKRNH
ncbi:MAG: hypothetical protein GY861_29250 [bacterium]|nr:hypothetical protein [bacterium]